MRLRFGRGYRHGYNGQVWYSENVDYKSLFITNGVTGGLSLLCSLFTQKDSIIFVEEPTYFLAINIFKDFKLDIRTISIEKDGLDVDELTAKIKEIRKKDNNDQIFLYTIPTFHNPTSYTMSEKKREQLGNLCNEEDLIVFADEVYQLLYFEDKDKPPPPLCYYNENIISLGSFSKILAPSLCKG